MAAFHMTWIQNGVFLAKLDIPSRGTFVGETGLKVGEKLWGLREVELQDLDKKSFHLEKFSGLETGDWSVKEWRV